MTTKSISSAPLLEVRGLKTTFFTDDGLVDAVDGIEFKIMPGESLGIVGESGSGKSVTALSILRMLSKPGKIVDGSIKFRGEEILTMRENRLRELRGNDIAMIFQEPMTSLDPLYSVGNQIREAIHLHQGIRGTEANRAAIQALRDVGIERPEERINAYPHQLSGGMRQRVMIAIALSCRPELLIADEPTTALDVTIQAKILDLIDELRTERKMALILITHNMGIVAEMCDTVAVMYRGKIVEHNSVSEVFDHPKHPYTRALLASIPRLDSVPKQPLPIVQWQP